MSESKEKPIKGRIFPRELKKKQMKRTSSADSRPVRQKVKLSETGEKEKENVRKPIISTGLALDFELLFDPGLLSSSFTNSIGEPEISEETRDEILNMKSALRNSDVIVNHLPLDLSLKTRVSFRSTASFDWVNKIPLFVETDSMMQFLQPTSVSATMEGNIELSTRSTTSRKLASSATSSPSRIHRSSPRRAESVAGSRGGNIDVGSMNSSTRTSTRLHKSLFMHVTEGFSSEVGPSHDDMTKFMKNLYYFTYPQFPFSSSQIQALRIAHERRNNLRSQLEAEWVRIWAIRTRGWKAALQSLFFGLRNGHLGIFYLVRDSQSMMFVRGGEYGFEETHAVISHCPRSLLEELRMRMIQFETNEDSSTVVISGNPSIPLFFDYLTNEYPPITCIDDSLDSNFSIPPSNHPSPRISPHPAPFSPVAGLFRTSSSTIPSSPVSCGAASSSASSNSSRIASVRILEDVPRLFCPRAFVNGSLCVRQYRSTVFARSKNETIERENDKSEGFSLVVEGTIFPHNLHDLCEVFRVTQGQFSVRMQASPVSTGFNMLVEPENEGNESNAQQDQNADFTSVVSSSSKQGARVPVELHLKEGQSLSRIAYQNGVYGVAMSGKPSQ